MYVPAFLLFFLAIWIFYNSIRPIEEVNMILWQNFHLFPLNWGIFLIVVSSMWFMVGIFLWKMYCVVSFMRELTKEYDFVMNPFNSDGFGGFKPFGLLLLDIILIATPITLYYIIVFIFSNFYDIPYFFEERIIHLFFGITYLTAAALILGYPLQNYHNVVEEKKAFLLGDVEERIDKCYREIENNIQNEDNISQDSMNQLRNFHEIALRINSVPSWPFTSFERIIIYISAIAPWVGIALSYLS